MTTLVRIRAERDHIKYEYKRVMSERDNVHTEIKELNEKISTLESELKQEQHKVKVLQERDIYYAKLKGSCLKTKRSRYSSQGSNFSADISGYHSQNLSSEDNTSSKNNLDSGTGLACSSENNSTSDSKERLNIETLNVEDLLAVSKGLNQLNFEQSEVIEQQNVQIKNFQVAIERLTREKQEAIDAANKFYEDGVSLVSDLGFYKLVQKSRLTQKPPCFLARNERDHS